MIRAKKNITRTKKKKKLEKAYKFRALNFFIIDNYYWSLFGTWSLFSTYPYIVNTINIYAV